MELWTSGPSRTEHTQNLRGRKEGVRTVTKKKAIHDLDYKRKEKKIQHCEDYGGNSSVLLMPEQTAVALT